MAKTFIIAEVACTWRFDYRSDQLKQWQDLCQQVSAAGCDAIKTQWTSDPVKMRARRKIDDPTAYDLLAWPVEWHRDLADARMAAGLEEYMCTVYLPEDVRVIDQYVQRHKIASLEADDMSLRQAMQAYKKPVLVSTGAHGWEELGWAFFEGDDIHLLHCTSCYPCGSSDLALNAMRRWYINEGNRFGPGAKQVRSSLQLEGLSDHSGDVRTGMLAVACGAQYLEVHVRHDLTPKENPDYEHSLTVDQLQQYVANVRWAESALGDGVKKVQPCEEVLRKHRVVS